MQMPVIELGKFCKTYSNLTSNTEPFCIAFVYTKDGNHVVKGMTPEVEAYIKEKFPRSFYRYTFWKNGISRGGWRAPRWFKLYFSQRIIGKRQKYIVSMQTKDGFKQLPAVRNLPKRWLPVYDEAILENKVLDGETLWGTEI